MELAVEQNDDLIRVYDDKNEVWKFVKRDRGASRQLLMIEETLSRYGLLKNEIRVYLYLARFGQKKAGEVAESISLHRTETYRILRDLEKKGIVFSVFRKTAEIHCSSAGQGNRPVNRCAENEDSALGKGKGRIGQHLAIDAAAKS